jgi:hypothetical protein
VDVDAKIDSPHANNMSREMIDAHILDLLAKARARSLAQGSEGKIRPESDGAGDHPHLLASPRQNERKTGRNTTPKFNLFSAI